MCRWFLAAALGVLWLGFSHANSGVYPQPLNSQTYSHLNWKMVGNQAIMIPQGGGTPVTMTVPSGAAANITVGNMTVTHPNNGMPGANGTSKVPVPDGNGRAAEFHTRMQYNPTTLGKNLLKWGTRANMAAAVGVGLYDLLKELDSAWGARQQPDGEGWDLFKMDKACSLGMCWVYFASNPGAWNPNPKPYVFNKDAACSQATAEYNTHGDYPYRAVNLGNFAHVNYPQHGVCRFRLNHYPSGALYNPGIDVPITGTQVPGEATESPLSDQEFLDKFNSKLSWPSTSAISRAIAEGARGGTDFDVDAPTITGPSSIPGPTTTSTSSGPDGTTINTTNTTTNITFNGDTITFHNSNVTNTTKPDGTTKTETVTSEPKEEADQCKKNPNSVGCAETDVPSGEIPKKTVDLTYSAENLGLGGGVCPADVVATVGGQSMTVFKYTPGCELLQSQVRPIVLLLSAMIAFFIIMPGGKPE